MTANSNSSEQNNVSFSMDDFSQALSQDKYDYNFKQGNVVRGKVFQYDSNGVYVDIGGKSPGFVPTREADWKDFTDVREILPLDHEFDFVIIREQDSEGQVKLSRRQLFIDQAWENLAEIQEKGSLLQMTVTGVNRGGVFGEIGGLKAFIPRSHLIEKDDLESLINQTLDANILQLERSENKLVLTQRNLARSSAMAKLMENEVIAGKVAKIQSYGVFVDFGGVSGLLHIKQISEGRIESLESLFHLGEEIKVVVMEIDTFKNRISLSTKMLESYPGEFLEKKQEVIENAEQRWAEKKAANNN